MTYSVMWRSVELIRALNKSRQLMFPVNSTLINTVNDVMCNQRRLSTTALHRVIAGDAIFFRKLMKYCSVLHQTAKFKGNVSSDSSAASPDWRLKTHTCGCLTKQDVGSRVILHGFVSHIRLEKFVLIRDGHGTTQIILPDSSKAGDGLNYEAYIEVEGIVKKRLPGQENLTYSTGAIEVEAERIQVLGPSAPNLPFLIREQNKPTEALGYRHRQLQLRYPHLQKNLRLRSDVSILMRNFLQLEEGFVDVWTPTLSCNTSGGANLFVVPTNVAAEDSVAPPSQEGAQYYCLVQSPQTYKQLLMMGQFEKYYQFATCYRNERSTPERQPEFVQVDLEMTGVRSDQVMALVERMLVYSWPTKHSELCGSPPRTPFPTITYQDAMLNYGSDKPDTSFGCKLTDVSAIVKNGCASNMLKTPLSGPSSSAHAFRVPKGQKLVTKKIHKSWEKMALAEHSIPGVCLLTVCRGKGRGTTSVKGQLAKFFSEEAVAQLIQKTGAEEGDAIVLAVGNTSSVLKLLGRLRLLSASLIESSGTPIRSPHFSFLWVVDFPLFEETEEGGLQSAHHPFTNPHWEDRDLIDTQPLKVRALSYDLVCNGCEVGGGSERISDPQLQEKILKLLNIEGMEYFTEALGRGCPPHAGIALGFDRLISLLCGADSIRDVIAFPKTRAGRCLVTGSPSDIPDQLKKLYKLP